MAPAVLYSVAGVLAIATIYFWWGRKLAKPGEKAPVEAAREA